MICLFIIPLCGNGQRRFNLFLMRACGGFQQYGFLSHGALSGVPAASLPLVPDHNFPLPAVYHFHQ